MNQMTYKVLVVDDDEIHYQLVEDFLDSVSLAKYELDWAGDYDTALRYIVHRKYDVCLLDFDLGARSGLDFIRESDVQARGVPIIFLTGRGSMEIDFEAMRSGVVDYLDKTQLQPNHLERTIRYAAERSKALQVEQEYRNFLEALLSMISVLNSSLEFEEVVERILMNIGKVIPHDIADFMLVEDGHTRVVKCTAHGDDALEKMVSNTRFALSDTSTFQTMQRSRLPLLIPNIADYPDWITQEAQPVQSYLGVPVFNVDDLLGFINLTSYQAHFFTEEHSERLQIFAAQAAIAIQNSQQYEHAQQAAAEEERTRLAHELHDSVSQTLFSASVIAETLPRLLKQDVDATSDGLTKLATITKSALAEMRSLLFELRPTALVETHLDVLLSHLANGMVSHMDKTKIDVSTTGQSYLLPPDVQVSLYRIAQECLNNIMKHAEANHANLNLIFTEDDVTLEIVDDGKGFDMKTISADHMGIQIMHERAKKNQIKLRVGSQINKGTHISANWQQ